jgi:hypothetical protein
MSRAKELKSNPDYNINLYELFSLFSPEGKSKYVETLIRIMKKTPNIEEHKKDIVDELQAQYGFQKVKLNELPTLQIVFFYKLIETMFNSSDLKSFQKFCELNERGLIKQNDLSTYNSFEELLNSLSLAEMAADTKDMEKQIRIVFENDEWLLVRPLTYHASKKYGANTKWCTTSEGSADHFMRYAGNGVLIYCINKKNGYKVASYNSLNKNDPEFSFWNQKDTRIDSMQTELTDNLLSMVKRESTLNAKTNRFLLSDDERMKEERILKNKGYHYSEPSPIMEAPTDVRIGRIRRALTNDNEPEQDVVEGSSNQSFDVQ